MLKIALLLLLLALLIGGFGLAIEAVRWMLIIAVVVLLASAVAGYVGQRGNAKNTSDGPGPTP
ncbi:hydrophobic protein [Phytoactinopolyspora halotolerans]|uniref:Hydrophobic protein n=1 Tax=Phytoactinopolyspora halotolerans TaxID=1981512 RepID=A0A6L9SE60_9ACTN|nr:hydrophobic protein [Phytoactinopolyspora halotolerans]NEE02370.1 hydrophobic protein [Phytoactinopolyspora halotolerans]